MKSLVSDSDLLSEIYVLKDALVPTILINVNWVILTTQHVS